jgi:cell division topological specificity factor
MKDEILQVITKYVEIDVEETEIRLERSDDSIALVSSVPVQRVIARPAIAT